MDNAQVRRIGPLAGVSAGSGPSDALALRVLPPQGRFALRCRPDACARAGEVFGVAVPNVPCGAAVAGERAALWLGPDEWLLLTAVGECKSLEAALTKALAGMPFSLIDVSHRDAGLMVEGTRGADLLNHGCPLDLSNEAFPVGMCTRTLFGKAQIILWHTQPSSYRVDVARSYADYVWKLLLEASHSAVH